MTHTRKKFDRPYAGRAYRREAVMLELVSSLPRAMGLALSAQCSYNLRHRRDLNFTPHQLAERGRCSVSSVYKALPLALELGLLILVASSKGRWSHVAATYRLGDMWPTWSEPLDEQEVKS